MTDERPAVAKSPAISDKSLRRLAKWGSAGLVMLLAAFCVVYYLGQHVNAGPSLAQRQVGSAEAAVKAQPNNIGLRLALAQTYLQDGRASQALEQFNEVLKAVPKSVLALQGRAAIFLKQGNLDGAKADNAKIIALAGAGEFGGADPAVEAAHYFLAVIANERHDWTSAAGELKAALAIDATDSDAWFLTGKVALKQNAPQSAAKAFTKSLSFVPNGWCDPYQGLIQAYGLLKDTKHLTYYTGLDDLCQHRTSQAQAVLTQLTTGPLAADAMLQLAGIAQAQGDTSAAVTWYQKVLKNSPTNALAKAELNKLTANPAASQAGGN